MKDTYNKEELKKEINGLKSDLNGFISENQMYDLFDKKRHDLDEFDTVKKEYKEANKKYKKRAKIKNLAVLGRTSIFLVPMILVPSIVGIITTSTLIDKTKEEYADEKIVYYCDNSGNESVLEEDFYNKDVIRVEFPYEKMKNGEYVKRIYEYDADVSNVEELEKIAGTDYLELLNDLGEPSSKNVIVEDVIDNEENQAKVSVVAALNQKSLGENINTKDVKLSFVDLLLLNLLGTYAGCMAALVGLIPCGICNQFFRDKLERIETKNDTFYEEATRDALKGKIKELKKTIKKDK